MKEIMSVFYKITTMLMLPFAIIGFSFLGSYGFIKVYFRITNGITYTLLVLIFALILSYGKHLQSLEDNTNITVNKGKNELGELKDDEQDF